MSDFAWIPSWTIKQKGKYLVIIKVADDGKTEQRRLKRTDKVQDYTIGFTNITTAVKEAIEAFYDTKKGETTSFTWTPPIEGASEITVRFDSDENWDYVSYNNWNGSFVLKVLS